MPQPFFTTSALILRETKYKEADRILTMYSADRGLITAKARGALRKGSKIAAATQMLTYSELTLFENREFLTVNEAVIKEPFTGLRSDFEGYALACYLVECIEALCAEETGDREILQLILNSLYALSVNMKEPEIVKAAFELRLMCLLGYRPDLDRCMICGAEEPAEPVLSITAGHICCRRCRNADTGITDYLDDASLAAMRHISNAPAKQIFAFKCEGEGLKRLGRATEDYLLTQTERRFGTLEYWKTIKS